MKDSGDTVISTEDFTHDAAGNITSAPDSCFQYDINNRLTMYNCQAVSYDMDGNMLSCKLDGNTVSFAYDSANRLISAGGHTYTYNAEDVRIRNLCADEDTTYTYNTNCKLSQLLMKTTGGVVTKYVYGRGLIGEEVNNAFKTYHFDCRGSTIAITDANCSITDTFRYDTYGKLIERTGESVVIFGYNGRDGVVTDKNGLIYMRARYYSPETRRFVNADIVAGKISNAVTLNRFAYANGNPVSYVDPFGLSAERAGISQAEYEKFLKTLRDLFAISKKQELAKFEVSLGSLTYYRNYELTIGSGPANIDKLIAGQIEISQSFDFSTGTFKKITGTEILLGIEYSVDIDDYNSVSASMTINYDGSMSTEYQISTEYENGFSLATTMGVKTTQNDNSPPPPVTVPDEVTEEEKEPSFWMRAGEVLDGIGEGLEAVWEGMADFAAEHPFLAGLAIAGSLILPGPQFGFI